MQQFVEQERPGRAEFTVVRDMVLRKLTDELRAAGWTVVADDEGVDYLSLAAQLAEQTQPLVQQDTAAARPGSTVAHAEPVQQAADAPPALSSVAAAAAAAAAAETAAAQRTGGTAPSTPGSKGYDLNSTLQGLQEMRARLEARRQKRAVEGSGAAAGNPSPATSAYQKALLNLKASMSKHPDVCLWLWLWLWLGDPTLCIKTGTNCGGSSGRRCSGGRCRCTRAQRSPSQRQRGRELVRRGRRGGGAQGACVNYVRNTLCSMIVVCNLRV